ncbi:Stk1 family PASTA domain-containing Ser/Thr kinase [Enterococcus italicus]|uniref:Stk1 family PASTA domain-containing Ser/Thr kinase n=1 Tax=Enterococcus italicus TaxID=246144 RepID=UPI00207363F9|nr:Stk1 family PASTA domain-containing Ser/Thr kinase [Enterococcus italicus]MCM6931724.1 Stk1 family PASTA domain-containing Ser/Thr kinase [Enterococcus italicus]
MLDIGKKINDRYLIIGNIGSGGMANVFLARDLILDREVAVKVLRYDFQNDQAAIRRFQREALAATELVHPNIVSVYDVGEEDGQQYLVMEYVKGMDLKRYIQTQYPIAYDKVVDIMDQILSAMSLAHHHRIIHRDLKPQNILINEEGVVKITDFGIAIALSETSITQTNSMLGSVHYLSPEQARGSMATNQSDIYAMGIILYEMITGRVPFDGESAVTIALKHFQDELPDIHIYSQQVPQALENVVLKATAKDPINRYKTTEEMQADLYTSLDANRAQEAKWSPVPILDETRAIEPIEEVVPEAPSVPEDIVEEQPTKKKLKRRWWILPLIVLLIVLTAGGYWVYASGRQEVTIPDVSNLSQTAAVEKLTNAGLNVRNTTKEVSSDEVKKGNVVRTDPQIGTEVKKNSRVTLYISTGKDTVDMQDYTDQTVADAKKALIALGFVEANITSTEEYSDEVDSGKIISQTPATDDKVVPSEAKIAFVVSKGKEPVTVPNLVGMTSSLAVQSLADIGITSPDITYQYSDQDKGDVIAQSPNSGQQAIPGETTVTLVVSSGIEKVTVPDLTGKTKAEATKALSDLGLTMTTTEEYSDTVKEGSVISNDQTNQEVKKGTAIAVVLSKGKEPEKKTFTVNLTAAFDKDGADTQVIKVSISGADDPTGQVNEVTLTKDSDDYTQAIAITVSGDNKATITITRNNTQVVSQQVDQAKQITIP